MMFQIKRSVLVNYGGILLLLLGLLLFWPDLLSNLLSTSGLSPLTVSMAKQPSLVALYAISQVLLSASYTALSVMLVYLAYRTQRDVPFHWVFLAFAGFLISSAITHFIAVITLSTPLYWLASYFRMVTAVASVAT